jgi:hypothetical protein
MCGKVERQQLSSRGSSLTMMHLAVFCLYILKAHLLCLEAECECSSSIRERACE